MSCGQEQHKIQVERGNDKSGGDKSYSKDCFTKIENWQLEKDK